jgi:hypothetical protein
MKYWFSDGCFGGWYQISVEGQHVYYVHHCCKTISSNQANPGKK